MTNVPFATGLMRVYANGDGQRGGVKFFVSKKLSDALAIKPGDHFDLRQLPNGDLELIRVAINVKEAKRGH